MLQAGSRSGHMSDASALQHLRIAGVPVLTHGLVFTDAFTHLAEIMSS